MELLKEASFGCFTGDCKHIFKATPGGVTKMSCLRELIVVEYDEELGFVEGLG